MLSGIAATAFDYSYRLLQVQNILQPQTGGAYYVFKSTPMRVIRFANPMNYWGSVRGLSKGAQGIMIQ